AVFAEAGSCVKAHRDAITRRVVGFGCAVVERREEAAAPERMKFEIITIFPDFFRGPLDYGIVRRAREAGLIEVAVHDLRAHTHDRHKTVDDRPFGGGEGMVLKAEPIFECVEALGVSTREERLAPARKETVILLSPQGRIFEQGVAEELSRMDRVVLICGRYEG